MTDATPSNAYRDQLTAVSPDEIPLDNGSTLISRWIARIVMIIAVSLSLYQLYTAGITALTALVQRSIHLGEFCA